MTTRTRLRIFLVAVACGVINLMYLVRGFDLAVVGLVWSLVAAAMGVARPYVVGPDRPELGEGPGEGVDR